jgi:beta-N-acetylhexosaminidase
LNQNLLRHELGFNGLIVSDSAEMGGLLSWDDSNNLAVEIIANGCDMLLFPVDAERDLTQLHAALNNGVLSQQRVDEAVIRILAMKAALGLHRSQVEVAGFIERDEKKWTGKPSANPAKEAGSKAITLVHDRAEFLPINPQQHKRLVIMEQSGRPLMPGLPTPSIEPLITSLRDHGFEVQCHAANTPFDPQAADLLLYVFTQEAALTVSHIGIDWALLHGHFPSSMQRYWHALPTVMISFGHPYFLYDASDVPTYINAYTAIPSVQEAVVKRLIGEEKFTGHSPVDPYCGLGSFYQLNKFEKN